MWYKSLHSKALSNWPTRGKRVKNVTGGKDHHKGLFRKLETPTSQTIPSGGFEISLRGMVNDADSTRCQRRGPAFRSFLFCVVLFPPWRGERAWIASDGLTGIKIIKRREWN